MWERQYFDHKKRCGTLQHRVKCTLCPLTFARPYHKHRHVRQPHSNNPLRFPCTICRMFLTTVHSLSVHMETVHAFQKPCYLCWLCSATFTRKTHRQTHTRRVHGRRCREGKINLQLNSTWWTKRLSMRLDNYTNLLLYRKQMEWKSNFCGFWMHWKHWSQSRKRDLLFQVYCTSWSARDLQGWGREWSADIYNQFNTTAIRHLPTVENLNPPLIRNTASQWEVSVMSPKRETLDQGQSYLLRLKAKYVRGSLNLTVV